MTDQANIVIIGGGVVGCAIARALSKRWSDVFLLEALPKLGMGASSRNSGVIHSGLYYPRDRSKQSFAFVATGLLTNFVRRMESRTKTPGNWSSPPLRGKPRSFPLWLKTGAQMESKICES